MNMIEAVKSVLTQYFGFRGRARRSEYWFWILATLLVAIVIAIAEVLLGLSYEGSGPISTIFNLLIFIPGLFVTFRRLHDIGRSGWWIGAFYLTILAFVFLAVGMAFGVGTDIANSSSTLAGFGLISIGFFVGIFIYAIVLLIFMCTDSQTGPNKYGPNPKNEGNYDVFG